MTGRPSPSDSATLHPVGKRKIGNDGNTWIVKEDKNGRKRWASYNSSTTKRKHPPRSKAKSKSPNKSKSKKAKSKSPKKSKSKKAKSKSPKKGKSKSKKAKSKSPKKRKSKSKKAKSKSPKKRKSKSKKAKSKSPKKGKSKSKSPQKASSRNIGTFAPMLANTYKDGMESTGYWASEKLDGVRSVFINGKFKSRNNNIFNTPKWFIDNISKKIPLGVVLDGELYTQRGDFPNIMSIVSKKVPIDSEWKQISFVVFDIPSVKGPFEERMKQLKTVVNTIGSKHVKLLNHIKVKSNEHLKQLQKTILSKGGEGVMLRQPGSFYEQKRSSTLLKVKTFLDDEAVVIGHELGSGKYENVLGHLIVKWYKGPNKGIQFSIGSGLNEQQRAAYKRLFPKGTIVKFKYFEVNESGKPRFPSFLGVRHKKDL